MMERSPSALAASVPSTPPIEPANVRPSIPPAPNIPRTNIPIGIIFFCVYDIVGAFAVFGNIVLKPLYVRKELGMDADKARTIIHSLSTVSFFLPLLGAIIVDSWIGKYKSISRFMLFTVAAHILLALSSTPPLNMNPRLMYLIISSILGSIASMFAAPCHAGFAGDQFVEGQEKQRHRYYSANYLIFNGSALIALIIFPMLRDEHCFGGQFCYPLAFGATTIILAISLIFLYCGRPFYRIVPPSGTVMKNFAICVWIAIREKFKNRTNREHWLDRADIRFSPEFINSVKAIFGLMVLFLPIPVYTCLYEQMNTSWTFQSDLLDGRVTESFEILPDSMDLINTVLVMILIPLFDLVIYPFLGKFGLLKTPLQRMCTGGFFIAFSFILGGLLFKEIEKEQPSSPPPGYVDLMMINTMDCQIDIYYTQKIYSITQFEVVKLSEIPGTDNTFNVVPKPQCPTTAEETFSLKLQSATAYAVIFKVHDANISMTYVEQVRERNPQGNSLMRFIYLDELPFPNAVLMLKSEFGTESSKLTNGFSTYFTLVPLTNYDLCWAEEKVNKTVCIGNEKIVSFKLYKGAIVETLLFYDNKTETASLKMMFAYPVDHIPIWYQFPQYLCITISEVMFEVTSLSFNYSEAPITMKAVVRAFWLFTRSMGHFLVVVVVQFKNIVHIEKESTTFFWFAGIMIVDMIIFCFLSNRYKYKTHVFAES